MPRLSDERLAELQAGTTCTQRDADDINAAIGELVESRKRIAELTKALQTAVVLSPTVAPETKP